MSNPVAAWGLGPEWQKKAEQRHSSPPASCVNETNSHLHAFSATMDACVFRQRAKRHPSLFM